MAFTLDLDMLSPVVVEDSIKQIQTYAAELIPQADFSKGTVLYDLLIKPAGILQAMSEMNVNRARNAGSLLRINRYPEVADEDMVDELLSNYRITRKGGTIAGGSVDVFISTNAVTAIPSGSVFTSGGLRFFANQSYVGVPSQGLVASASDRLIRQLNEGAYVFAVEVTAEADGSAYQISQNTTLVMQNPPSNYISSVAAYDFSAGVDVETNRDVMQRMAAGLANRTPGNVTNVEALLRDNYEGIVNVSIVGYGQQEMSRDQDNLFLFSYGGKSDTYAQTALRPTLVRVTKQALLVNAEEGTWQTLFDRDEFAGAYKVNAVLPTDRANAGGSLKITMEARAVDTGSDGIDDFTPHFDNYTQAAFSRYQTLSLEFQDTYTDTSELTVRESTQDYYVDLLVMPYIAQLQDEVLSDPELRAHRYDDIIRAPIPVLMSINLGLRLRDGDAPNLTAMRQAIADRINQIGFRSIMSSSYVIDAAHGLLGSTSSVVLPLDMVGELIDPSDGSSVIYRSSTEIRIPTDYTKSISPRTVTFFCDAASVNIYIES